MSRGVERDIIVQVTSDAKDWLKPGQECRAVQSGCDEPLQWV